LRDVATYAFAAGGVSDISDLKSSAQVVDVYAKALRVVWLSDMTARLMALVLIPFERVD
jgi:hypothetical protein